MSGAAHRLHAVAGAAAGEGARGRRQWAGAGGVHEALAAGHTLRLVLVERGAPLDTPTRAALEAARAAGARVREASRNDLRRMSHTAPAPLLLALSGPAPDAPPEGVLAAGGAAWLLVDVAYPGNAGFAIRTAEVSGADGVFLDSPLDGRGRKQALRAAMHAERFVPVHWVGWRRVVEGARAAGRRIVALESEGGAAPWDLDLTGAVLLVAGSEGRGIPPACLEACDAVATLPMAGFVPSYNVQAAMAAVALERLRQLGAGAAGGPGSVRALPAAHAPERP